MNAGSGGESSFPLDESHRQGLDTVLSTEQVIAPLLARCKQCGLPVDAQLDAFQWQWNHARDIKAAFFPGSH